MRVIVEIEPQLKGNRHSLHNYTLNSLCSIFIEDYLLKGTPVMEVADMAVHARHQGHTKNLSKIEP